MTIANANMGPVYISRSAADCWGMDWPPEVACEENGRRVTWSDLGARKRKQQAEQLARKRRVEPPRIVPAYVWTFRVPGTFYAGWWCWLVTRRERFGAMWTDRGKWAKPRLAESIVRAYPMGLLPMPENFERWMKLLAETRPRRHPHDPRPAGSLVGWYDGRWSGRFALTRDELLTPDN